MRLALDTNVLVAAFVARGVCHELLEHCVREHDVVISDFVIREFESTLRGKFRVPRELIARAIELLQDEMEIVQPAELPERVCRDPEDDWILATAIEGRCRCLVTGDKDLLSLEECAGVRIVSPRSFWTLEAG